MLSHGFFSRTCGRKTEYTFGISQDSSEKRPMCVCVCVEGGREVGGELGSIIGLDLHSHLWQAGEPAKLVV